MKLILTAAVDKLGVAGDVVEVKDGYGRNFLVPRGFAIRWTRGGEKQISGIQRSRDAREIRGLDHAAEVRTQLEGLTIELPVRAGDTGKLFGAVTPSDVALARQAGRRSLRSTSGPCRSVSRSRPSAHTRSASSCTTRSPRTSSSRSWLSPEPDRLRCRIGVASRS